MRKIVSSMVILVTALASALFAATPAEAASYLHNCGNPSTVVNNRRAGLCATLEGSSGSVSVQSEAFCQVASAPYATVACHGIEAGVDLQRRNRGSSTWTTAHHSLNKSCGSFGGSACTSSRLIVSYSGLLSGTCVYFRTKARASIRLPNGTQISGIVLYTAEWGTPACAA